MTQVLALIDQLLQLEQDVWEVVILEYHLTRYDWTEGKQRASFCDQSHLENIERKIVNRFCTSLGKPDDDLVLERDRLSLSSGVGVRVHFHRKSTLASSSCWVLKTRPTKSYPSKSQWLWRPPKLVNSVNNSFQTANYQRNTHHAHTAQMSSQHDSCQ